MTMGKFVNSLPEIFLWPYTAPKEGGEGMLIIGAAGRMQLPTLEEQWAEA